MAESRMEKKSHGGKMLWVGQPCLNEKPFSLKAKRPNNEKQPCRTRVTNSNVLGTWEVSSGNCLYNGLLL